MQVFSGSAERVEHPSVFNSDRINANGFRYRRAHGRPGTDVKPALVQRAFDLMSFQKTVAQPRMAMGADIVGYGTHAVATGMPLDVARQNMG